jgi:hypothetical protein
MRSVRCKRLVGSVDRKKLVKATADEAQRLLFGGADILNIQVSSEDSEVDGYPAWVGYVWYVGSDSDPENPPTDTEERIQKALDVAFEHGQDASHHQSWVIDQMVRALAGGSYDRWVSEYQKNSGGCSEWDVGVPP